MSNFEADVRFLVDRTTEKIEAVVKQSLMDVIDTAQRVGPSKANPGGGKGGKMPVDTGFLRASGQAGKGGLPTGEVRGDENAKKYQYDDGNTAGSQSSSVVLSIARLKLGDTFYYGWTANYARYMNTYYGFLSAAVQRWQEFIDRNCNNLNSIDTGISAGYVEKGGK